MDPDGIREFMQRDWARVADSKTTFWRERKRGQPVAELLTAADALRRHARALRPDWPSAQDRADDLAAHVRVSEALGAVAARSR